MNNKTRAGWLVRGGSGLMVLYVVLVASFSLAYWLRWLSDPDIFLVHEDLNRYPPQALRALSNEDPSGRPDFHLATGDIGVVPMVMRLDEEQRELWNRIEVLKKARDAAESQQGAILDVLEQEQWANVDSYEKSILRPLDLRLKSTPSTRRLNRQEIQL